MSATQKEIVRIIGAGPVGCLLAIQLGRRGYHVELYESRPDIRQAKIPAGRSINLALSLRGIHALTRLGLEQAILRDAIPMLGRMIHDPHGACVMSRYGIDDRQYINSISRAQLNRALLTVAEETPGCKINFGHRLSAYEVARQELCFTTDRGEVSVADGIVIGSDGTSSVLRRSLTEHYRTPCREDLLDYGYKELTIPAGAGATFQIEQNALHIWPRGRFMLIALPNHDGSFTCTLFLPFHSAPGAPESFDAFEGSDSAPRLTAFFAQYFADAQRLIPDLHEAFCTNPTGKMLSVHCDQWSWDGRAALIGDAAHAIVPFFGQGLNCSFEDCSLLDEILEGQGETPNLGHALMEFGAARLPDAEAISTLAQDNFVEMRDKVSAPRFLLEKEIEKRLMKSFPELYVSRYSMVTFSRAPYRDALRAGRAQDALLNRLSEGLTHADQLDLALAERLVREYANPQ